MTTILKLICVLIAALIFGGQAIALPPIWGTSGSTQDASVPGNRRGGNPSYAFAPVHPRQAIASVSSPAQTVLVAHAKEKSHLEDEGGSLNGNYQITIPLLSLPGRGSNLDLAMHYSSQLWASVSGPTSSGQDIAFDPDADWPSPGWSLGFGRIITAGPGPRPTSAVLINADHSRQSLHLLKGPILAGTSREMGVHGQSGARIVFCCYAAGGIDGETATLTHSGRKVDYMTPTPGNRNSVYYPTRITDANGNYISIRYVLNSAGQPAPPAIDTVTDTTGRPVKFHYDASGRLVSLAAPGKDSEPRVYARFLYWNRDVRTRVSPNCTPFSSSFDGIFGVVIHGDKADSGIWIPPSSQYGISRWFYETVGVQTRSPSPDVQSELVSQGTETRRVTYEYPSDQDLACIHKAPTYSSKTETWIDPVSGGSKSATTAYSSSSASDGDLTAVTIQPDGSRNRQIYAGHTDPAIFKIEGQVRRIENADRSGKVLSSTDFEWVVEGESYGAPRLRAMVENIDPLARGKRVEFTYDKIFASLVTEQTHYAYRDTGTSLPWTFDWSAKTAYLRDQVTLRAGLIDLPRTTLLLKSNGTSRAVVARSDYEYDSLPLVPVGPLVQYADPGLARGNVSKITRWASPAVPSDPVITRLRYDSAGNLSRAFDITGSGVEYLYEPTTAYSLPAKITYGAVNGASNIRISTSYTYFNGIGLVSSVTDPAGNNELINYVPGPQGWRLARRKYPNDTLEVHDYDDLGLSQSSRIQDARGNAYNSETALLDGRGQVRRHSSKSDRLIDREYDSMGRLERQSLPYGSGESRIWATNCFDAIGRVEARWLNGVEAWPPVDREPCHTVAAREELHKLFWHDESRAPPASAPISPRQGTTTRVRDAWGRERWTQRDARGNLHFVVEPDPANPLDIFGSNTRLTTFEFNLNSDLVGVDSQSQFRRFTYDGLGRMVGQKLAERDATLTANGVYVGTGDPTAIFSDFFAYDSRSNITARMDARGIRTVYDYRADPLNRLQEVRYEAGPQTDPSSKILPTRMTRFVYATSGDLRQISSVDVPGIVNTLYRYDELGRPLELTSTVAAYSANPFVFTIGYDALGRASSLDYPARYGSGNARRSLAQQYAGDALQGMTLDGEALISDLRLTADGQLRSLRTATASGWVTETFEIDPLLKLPVRQSAVDANGVKVLDLEYRYRRQSASLSGRTESPGVVGSITAIRDLQNSDFTQDFAYDGLGRLQTAISGESMFAVFDPLKVSWQKYSYDTQGNRTQVQAFRQVKGRQSCAPLGCETVPLDEAHHDGVSKLPHDLKTNRIASSAFGYDAAGNLIRGLVLADGSYVPRSYAYDAANRLSEVRDGRTGALVERFLYGFDNRRIGASADDLAWTYSVWLGDKLLSKYSSPLPSTPPVWEENVYYLGDRHVATERAGSTVLSHLADQRGVKLTLSSTAGTLNVSRQGAMPYGTESVSASEWQTTRRFTSYDRAGPGGLDNAVNRQYDPRLGKFLQVDTLGAGAFSLEDPQSLNLYAYGRGDPINSIDPDGQLWIATWWRYCYGEKAKTDCGPKHLLTLLWAGDTGTSPGKHESAGGGSAGAQQGRKNKCRALHESTVDFGLHDVKSVFKLLTGGSGYRGILKAASTRLVLTESTFGPSPLFATEIVAGSSRVGLGRLFSLAPIPVAKGVLAAGTTGYIAGDLSDKIFNYAFDGYEPADFIYDALHSDDFDGAYDPTTGVKAMPDCAR